LGSVKNVFKGEKNAEIKLSREFRRSSTHFSFIVRSSEMRCQDEFLNLESSFYNEVQKGGRKIQNFFGSERFLLNVICVCGLWLIQIKSSLHVYTKFD